MPEAPPDYKVYRSRRRLRDRFSSPGETWSSLLHRQRRQRDRFEQQGEGRRRLSVGRVLKWLALAGAVWLLLSIVIFFVSAQVEQGVSGNTDAALSSGGSLMTGSNILVLGSDQRPKGSHEPGAGGPSRSDSMLLLHAAFGSVRRLSILRDSYAQIPGHGAQKINAAYAIGGPALTIKTVEQYMGNGLKINHLVEVNFDHFPQLIDALGGVDVALKRCVRSQNTFETGHRFRLSKGTHHLGGQQALEFARIRENACSPNEDDRQRAARQQQVLSAMRSQILSPTTFFRLPWVSWNAPKALRTDMAGPGLAMMFTDLMTGGTGQTHVLRPSGSGPGASLTVSVDERARAVARLVGRQ